MLHFNLESPVRPVHVGEFISPERGWKHLTRTLIDYEMFIVTEGVLYIADDKREYTVRAGEYLIMSPTPHQHGSRVCRCRFYWLHFHCPSLPASLSLPACGAYTNGETVKSVAERLIVQDGKNHRGLYSGYLATELLLLLAEGNSIDAEPSATRQERLCRDVKNYVEWHRFSDVRVCDMAHELGYHEKYLSAVFSQTEGISLKKYIAEQRLKEAKRLLLEADYSVSEVAYYLHFKSPHNFSRFFRSCTGKTPVEWREEHRRASAAE